MTAPLLLLMLAGLASIGASVLRRATWPYHAPVRGVLAWQALSWCFVASLLLAGVALALPALPWSVSDGVATFVGACAEAIRGHYSTPGGAAVATFGALASVLIAGRVAVVTGGSWWAVCRTRARQRTMLRLVASRDDGLAAWVLPERRPAAYCIPGRTPMIVLTEGAVRRRAVEVDAVLAHERAHLRERHDLVVHLSQSLTRALPGIPLLTVAAREISALLEMHADDRASTTADRHALASALAGFAGASPRDVPDRAIAATGGGAVTRVERLASSAVPLRRVTSWLVAAMVTAFLLAPAAAVATPAVEVALRNYCPVLLH